MTTRSKAQLTRQNLKELHLKQIFLAARSQAGGVSRAELTSLMKLSFPSVSALVDELMGAGILKETGLQESNYHGRPRMMLQVVPDFLHVPVFELNRWGYRFALYDLYGKMLREEFLSFDRPEDKILEFWYPALDEICSPLVNCIDSLSGTALADIVLSLPGNMRPQGHFSSSSSKIISPPGFLSYLEEKTGHRVLHINRSDCFAYVERADDSSLDDYIYLYISEGIGAGIIREGKIFESGPWRAGEVGHMSVDYQGRPCSCGSKGCLERYLSIDAITADCSGISGKENWDFLAVCQAYVDGDPGIGALVAEKAEILCAALNNMFALHPVSHIIIGGEITLLGEKFLSCLQKGMERRTSGMYRGKSVLTFSKNRYESSTMGAFQNYVNNLLNLYAFY